MTQKSFCPLYLQTWMWKAELTDGEVQREWSPDGSETLFNQIKRDRLLRFHLISIEDEDYWFNCRNGFFHVGGRIYVFPLAGLPNINYGIGLIQYKDACQAFIPGGPTFRYQGFSIGAYHIGWKVEKDEILSQVILRVQVLPEPTKLFFQLTQTFIDIRRKYQYHFQI